MLSWEPLHWGERGCVVPSLPPRAKKPPLAHAQANPKGIGICVIQAKPPGDPNIWMFRGSKARGSRCEEESVPPPQPPARPGSYPRAGGSAASVPNVGHPRGFGIARAPAAAAPHGALGEAPNSSFQSRDKRD